MSDKKMLEAFNKALAVFGKNPVTSIPEVTWDRCIDYTGNHPEMKQGTLNRICKRCGEFPSECECGILVGHEADEYPGNCCVRCGTQLATSLRVQPKGDSPVCEECRS